MVKKNIKVLLAEDDKNLGEILKTYLEAKGYPVKLSTNGDEALQLFSRENFDICILDIMMPVRDGFSLAREIRKKDKKIPIIFLTAKSLQDDIVKGFQLGADDYITKPFSMEVLLMRISAVLRRSVVSEKNNSPRSNVFKIGKIIFDHNRQLINYLGKEQKLTSKEADLLKLLCETPNEVLDRSVALKEIWRDDSYFNARSMDVYITKLRKFLRDDPEVELLNVHGVGFKIVGNIEEI
jgi:DNA-binding response OmpR family regulator